ncbi:hypothetical protein EZH22_11315 [Xanthobacter dioxanivorans]|uniref:Uncharacterized protein n=1 Tax=Xanthobacter dioxanivorans TaxID=2528964 RepID=A0A974PTH3_9HYPH|nr:hypothetical protein [Xanthobacter dioxanivorans]QRG08810.1 hypothetical protein EZH22_11315 [Xanthobacter dioxanivorans]
MARVEISFCELGNRSAEGMSAGIALGEKTKTEVVTSGATSVATSTASDAPDGFGFVNIWSNADVWVVTGAAPVAAVPASGQIRNGWRVGGYMPTAFAVRRGDRVAVITI